MGTSVLPGGLGTGCPPGSEVDPVTGECVPTIEVQPPPVIIVTTSPGTTTPPPTTPGQPPTRTSTTSNPRQGGTRTPPTIPQTTTSPGPAPPGGREPGAPSVPYNPPGRIGLWPGPIFNAPSTSTSSSVTTTSGGGETPGGGEGPIFVNTTNLVNVTDQSASNAVQNVANAVQDGINQSIDNASTVAENTYNQIQGAIGQNVTAIDNALAFADNTLGGAISGIEGGIETTLGGIGATIGNSLANALNPAADALARIAIILSQQIGGLAGAIAEAVARIVPVIVAAVTGSLSPIAAVLAGIQGAINGSLVALTQLGSDVSGGFGSLDSTLGRLLSDWESYNTPFVESQTGYPDGGNLHSDLSDIVRALGGLVTAITTGIRLNASEWLAPPCNSQTIEGLLDAPQKFQDWDLGIFKNFAYALWGVVMSILKVWPTALKYWEIIGQSVDQDCPNGLLPPAQLVDAVMRGYVTQTQAVAEAGRGNLDPTRFKTLQDLASHQLAPSELLEALYRGIIVAGEYSDSLAAQGWTSGQQQVLQALGRQLLTAEQVRELVQRGLITPDVQDALLKILRYDDSERQSLKDLNFRPPNMSEAIAGFASEKALNDLGVSSAADVFTIPDPIVSAANNEGLDPQTRALRWYDHWQLGGIEPWLNLYYRSQITRSQLDAVFTKNQIPLPVGDALISSGRPIIQFRTIATMIQSKIITPEQGLVLLKEHGYDDAHANILLAYAQRPTRSQAAKNAAQQRLVSLGIAKEEYIDGSITGDQYLAILTQHGFTVDGANTELQVVNAHQAMLARKQAAQFIVDEYGAGLIDQQTAIINLSTQGLTAEEFAKYSHKIRAFKQARTKIPSEADLNHFLQLSIIDSGTYKSQLEAGGYTAQAAQWFLSWRQHPPVSAAATPTATPAPAGG